MSVDLHCFPQTISIFNFFHNYFVLYSKKFWTTTTKKMYLLLVWWTGWSCPSLAHFTWLIQCSSAPDPKYFAVVALLFSTNMQKSQLTKGTFLWLSWSCCRQFWEEPHSISLSSASFAWVLMLSWFVFFCFLLDLCIPALLLGNYSSIPPLRFDHVTSLFRPKGSKHTLSNWF